MADRRAPPTKPEAMCGANGCFHLRPAERPDIHQSPWCRYHYCHQRYCQEQRTNNSNYCSAHMYRCGWGGNCCNACDDISHRFCQDHECVYPGCINPRVHNHLCATHQCKAAWCPTVVRMKHGFLSTCCAMHTCREYWCLGMAESVGYEQPAIFCRDHWR